MRAIGQGHKREQRPVILNGGIRPWLGEAEFNFRAPVIFCSPISNFIFLSDCLAFFGGISVEFLPGMVKVNHQYHGLLAHIAQCGSHRID